MRVLQLDIKGLGEGQERHTKDESHSGHTPLGMAQPDEGHGDNGPDNHLEADVAEYG